MEKVTIKEYAVKHKLSIFNVMKMVKSKKLQSEEIEIEGKNIIYILINNKIEEEIKSQIVPIDEKKDIDLKLEVQALKKELKLLKKEIIEIKKRI
jgi:hypothetical protein